MPYFSCEDISNQVIDQLRSVMPDNYIAILIVGAAARNEITVGPNGLVLSDLDFLVVFKTRNLISSTLKGWKYQKAILEIKNKIAAEYNVEISIGLTNSSKKYWAMATPLMWELKGNAVVLDGDDRVKEWPKIQSDKEIPAWEGIRLIANRTCELLGVIANSPTRDEEGILKLQYVCMKLALACSEAVLISAQLYRSTYRERQSQHDLVAYRFSGSNNPLIRAAYRAKLGQDQAFYSLDITELIQSSIKCCMYTLESLGIKERSDWVKRGWTERPYFVGFPTDILFFVENLLRGNLVAARHAIMDVYADALTISKKLAGLNTFPFEMEILGECGDHYNRFKATPQFVCVIKQSKP
jgi:hypothetical protein